MECRVCGEAVVTVRNGGHGNLYLEMSLEHEVFKFEDFVVFLDGFGPNGFAEFDFAGCDFDGRRLQEFVGRDVRVHMPVVRNYDVDDDGRFLGKCPCGVVERGLGRLHRVHVEFLGLHFGNSR